MGQSSERNNQSFVTDFILTGFSNDHDAQILHFVMFLLIYLAALMGNLLIIIVVSFNHHLHTPMHFFLVNLSISDICYISTTIPKSISTALTNDQRISFAGCLVQVFFVAVCAGSELALLTIMAYDRYVAICHPLQYFLIMNRGACIQMAVVSWLTNLISALLHTCINFSLQFCGSNIIGQYFCDIPQLQKISCTDTEISQNVIIISGIIFGSFCTGLIFVSYGYIFSVVLTISSVHSRYKALSTCIPHLTVFSLFLITVLFSYMRSKSLSSRTMDLLSAVLYTVLPPLLNPIIYSFRNKDIQEGVCKIMRIF
ncbi:olfactory receptor 14A16-like [Varanus komodoensis]|uniref:olfactory receptor 14A16-like n=1 Tax=Varanus komodoensis TaxID=61221 RepID=UPI001CF7AB67|nr:olfactory receptor 14A16-like [Varanus komodoensis]